MHLRYSWTRSMSSCCQRHDSCGHVLGRRERLDGLVDLVVPGHVGDEVADEREGPHRLDGDRLVEVEVRQARLAGQARPAVHLRAARTALGGLAVPADGEVRCLVTLDPVQGVEHDHPLLGRDVELVEVAGGARRAAEDPEVRLRHRSLRRQCAPSRRPASSRDIFGSLAVLTAMPPSRARDTMLLRVAPVLVVGSRVVQPAVRAAALGPLSGAAGDRLGDGQQGAQLEDEVPARVVRPPAVDLDVRRPDAQLRQALERLDAGRPRSGRSRRAAASCPAGRAGSRTGPRPRSARAARRARARRPRSGSGRDRASSPARPRARPTPSRSVPRTPAGPRASCRPAGWLHACRRRPHRRRRGPGRSSRRYPARPGSRP